MSRTAIPGIFYPELNDGLEAALTIQYLKIAGLDWMVDKQLQDKADKCPVPESIVYGFAGGNK